MKNLVMGYVQAPERKKREVLTLIAKILDFSPSEVEQVCGHAYIVCTVYIVQCICVCVRTFDVCVCVCMCMILCMCTLYYRYIVAGVDGSVDC